MTEIKSWTKYAIEMEALLDKAEKELSECHYEKLCNVAMFDLENRLDLEEEPEEEEPEEEEPEEEPTDA